jgi:UDP-glucuronate 4-epimerase
VEAIVRSIDHISTLRPLHVDEVPNLGSSSAPWRVYNIDNNSPVELLEVVRLTEETNAGNGATNRSSPRNGLTSGHCSDGASWLGVRNWLKIVAL